MSLLAPRSVLRNNNLNFRGTEARPNVLPAAGEHNTDYVNCAPSEQCEGFPFELPGDAPPGNEPPSRTSGLQARRGAQHFAQPSWKRHQDSGSASPAVGDAARDFRFVARREINCKFVGAKCRHENRHQVSTIITRFQPQCYASSLAGRAAKLRVGPSSKASSPSGRPARF